MPTATWDVKEKYLTRKESFEEMLELLKAGNSEDVIDKLEDILKEMNNG